MILCRVFVNPDGSLRIMRPNMRYWDSTECTDGNFCARVLDEDTAKDASLFGLSFYDVDISSLPTDRTKRHAWRWADNPGVYVDEAVHDPEDPRKEKLDRIAKAETIAELKEILKEMVR